MTDEDDNPYEGNAPGVAVGKLQSFDYPADPISDTKGANGDRLHVYLNFQEFVRLQIGGKWYRVSDYCPWRHHYKLKRTNGKWDKEADETFDLSNQQEAQP